MSMFIIIPDHKRVQVKRVSESKTLSFIPCVLVYYYPYPVGLPHPTLISRQAEFLGIWVPRSLWKITWQNKCVRFIMAVTPFGKAIFDVLVVMFILFICGKSGYVLCLFFHVTGLPCLKSVNSLVYIGFSSRKHLFSRRSKVWNLN